MATPANFVCRSCGAVGGKVTKTNQGSILVVETDDFIYYIEWATVIHKLDGSRRSFMPNQQAFDTLMDHYKK